jgi:hypothetical protein
MLYLYVVGVGALLQAVDKVLYILRGQERI